MITTTLQPLSERWTHPSALFGSVAICRCQEDGQLYICVPDRDGEWQIRGLATAEVIRYFRTDQARFGAEPEPWPENGPPAPLEGR